MATNDVYSHKASDEEANRGIDPSELSVLESALSRTVEDRFNSNTSAISAALQMRRNLE